MDAPGTALREQARYDIISRVSSRHCRHQPRWARMTSPPGFRRPSRTFARPLGTRTRGRHTVHPHRRDLHRSFHHLVGDDAATGVGIGVVGGGPATLHARGEHPGMLPDSSWQPVVVRVGRAGRPRAPPRPDRQRPLDVASHPRATRTRARDRRPRSQPAEHAQRLERRSSNGEHWRLMSDRRSNRAVGGRHATAPQHALHESRPHDPTSTGLLVAKLMSFRSRRGLTPRLAVQQFVDRRRALGVAPGDLGVNESTTA